MYMLDTNALSELFKENAKIAARFYQALDNNDEITLSTITRFELLMRGRYQAILTAATKDDLLIAQSRLEQDELRLMGFPILGINAAAGDHFVQLSKAKGIRKIGRADLLIACIALAHDATLVTRNVKDFAKIPNLKIENWAT